MADKRDDEKTSAGTDPAMAGAAEMTTPTGGEPTLDAPDHVCKACGAKFAGEGSRKAYQNHMEAFHPARA